MIENTPHSPDNTTRCPSKIISCLLLQAQSDSHFQDKLDELNRLIKSGQTPLVLYKRAQYVLQALQGESINDIAASMKVCTRTVYTWIGRFLDHGLKGLYDKHRSVRPLTFTSEVEKTLDFLLIFEPDFLSRILFLRIIRIYCRIKKNGILIWLPQSLMSQSQPLLYTWQSSSYCHSNNPNLPLKSILIDLLYRVGKYLGYDVYCFDEKPCVQAIRREFCLSASGQISRSDRYERHGHINVFGLLDFNTGKIKLATSDVKYTAAIADFLLGFFSQP